MHSQSEYTLLKEICATEKIPEELELHLGDYLHCQFDNISINHLSNILKFKLYPEGTRLSFNHCSLINTGIKTLFDILALAGARPNLKFKFQNHQDLDSTILQNLAKVLESGRCGSGFEVVFYYDEFNKKDLEVLALALASGKAPKNLSLEFYHSNIDAQAAFYFAEALKSGLVSQGLYLDFTCNELGNEGLKYLSEALSSGKCPENLKLNLWKNQIGKEGFFHLAEALASGQCPKGLSINLRYNRMRGEGIEYLSKALISGNAPDYLSLTLSELDEWDYRKLGLMLKSGKCPAYLNMTFIDKIGEQAIAFLVDGLESGLCPNGLALDFTFCALSKKSIIMLLHAVQKGCCPENFTLNLSDNKKGVSCAIPDLIQTIQSPAIPTGFALFLNYNRITDEVIGNMIEAAKKQKPANRFSLFVHAFDKRKEACLESLAARHLIQKAALMIIGMRDANSTLYHFNLYCIKAICDLLVSCKQPLFNAVEASLTLNKEEAPGRCILF